MPASYADLLLFKSYIGAGDNDDAENALMQHSLDAATDFINTYTGRTFYADDAATKRFHPTSPNYLDLIPDIRTVTSVAVDAAGDFTFSETLAATDYYLVPLVPLPDAGIYQRLMIAPNSSMSFAWGQSTQVQVVGDWGYVVDGAPPAAIIQACLIQASRLFSRKGAPFGVLENTDIGQFTRIGAMDPDVKALLNPYKSRASAWVAV
jgi:hypothetical protein